MYETKAYVFEIHVFCAIFLSGPVLFVGFAGFVMIDGHSIFCYFFIVELWLLLWFIGVLLVFLVDWKDFVSVKGSTW